MLTFPIEVALDRRGQSTSSFSLVYSSGFSRYVGRRFLGIAGAFNIWSPHLCCLKFSQLAAIQAFAKAEFIATIPGMDWILTFHGGSVTNFVNGYLPVVALLCLILIL